MCTVSVADRLEELPPLIVRNLRAEPGLDLAVLVGLNDVDDFDHRVVRLREVVAGA